MVVRKSVVISGGFQTSNRREKVFQWVSHEAGKIFFVSFGKASFFFGESKLARSRASELCFVTNALNAKRPGRNAGL